MRCEAVRVTVLEYLFEFGVFQPNVDMGWYRLPVVYHRTPTGDANIGCIEHFHLPIWRDYLNLTHLLVLLMGCEANYLFRRV